jgi:hypothetical protein
MQALLIKHPEVFYVSLKGTCDSGFLQEAYEGSKLKEKDPLALLKERMAELAAQGKKAETIDDDNDDWDDDNEQDDDSLRVSLCMLSWVYYWDLHINLIHSLKCALLLCQSRGYKSTIEAYLILLTHVPT